MAWWNSSWAKKKSVTLTGTGVAQTDYQVKLNVIFDSDMKSDFSDLRFINNAEDTQLNAWLESKIDDTSAVIWVETDTPADTVEADIYMYYGNSGAVSDWDGAATFNFFDDFTGDLSKWSTSGSPTIVSEKVELDGTDQMISTTKFGYGYAFEAYSEADEQDTDLIGAQDTIANQNNVLQFQNSDSTHNNIFNAFRLNMAKSGASSSNSVTDWDDFRNTLRRYSIYRPAANDVTFVQDAHSARYTTGNIPTVDLGVVFRVWDSSQASTLKVDWACIRKYTANSATYAFGSEQSNTGGWTGKINDVTNPAKVFGIVVANISKIMGV